MIREKISLSIHEMTVVAMMVAMIAILGAVPGIPLGFIPVPIVLQNMGIISVGVSTACIEDVVSIFMAVRSTSF